VGASIYPEIAQKHGISFLKLLESIVDNLGAKGEHLVL
jgi:hypothetical protein